MMKNQETQHEGKDAASLQPSPLQDPSSSGDGKNNIENEVAVSNQSPLSWTEARDRLRCKLEQWKEERKQYRRNSSADMIIDPYDDQDDDKNEELIFSWKSLEDPDLLLVTIPMAALHTLLSFILPATTIKQSQDEAQFTKRQQAAAILLLGSSLFSTWITKRRRKVSRETDRSIERRRCVSAFLDGMTKSQSDDSDDDDDEKVKLDSDTNNHDVNSMESMLDNVGAIPRKNVEDVHSTYRISCSDIDGKGEGQWHRIPTLLLVEGDFIALKVGDTAPAKCRPLSSSSSSDDGIIEAGERLTVQSLPKMTKETLVFHDTPTPKAAKNSNQKGGGGLLPQGRYSVKYHSNELLLLANGVRIFVLLETPIDLFLRKEQTAKHRPPAVLRQGKAIRIAFFIIGLSSFFLTLLFLLVRPGGAQGFFQSYTCFLPIWAALSVLPITSPVYLYLLESIGTSRILATAHPLASNQKWNRELMDRGGTLIKPSARLLFRYITATCSSRIVTTLPIRKGLSSKKVESSSDTLLNIPPASLYLLEKLGVVTALTLIDDELACDPFSTPQQLLIPSGQGGLKLLDLCPVYEEEDDADASEGTEHNGNTNNQSPRVRRSNSAGDVSSDSDDSNDETRFNFNHSFYAPRKTLRSIRKYKKKKFAGGKVREEKGEEEEREETKISSEVQFEDPQWWKFLPSLKCIGLVASAFGEGLLTAEKRKKKMAPNSSDGSISKPKTSLIDHLCCVERERNQLRLLSQCIGFDTAPNESGSRGDLSCFVERLRLHIISSNLLRERMQLDSHAMGLEEFRNWSLLYTDADVVFVKDKRSGGDLILSCGDSRVVTKLCPDCFQGENSTISPLTAGDRKVINNTQKEWMLSDLDVQAFSYAPLPYTADQKIGSAKGKGIYLLDNAPASNPHIPSHDYWGLVKHQIFLGLLGSSVGPRKEIEPFIHSCNDAGVRFVYFSPRNMRRTKELASQMGLDVAWNCCISLRPLEEGADDNFRMTSNYADWDVNAKLPHGVEDVKRHLEEVDNVPLLVSLYTDVSKKTTAEMVDVFQDYNDTVLAVGLSHLPGNQKVFFGSDIAIGVDVLSEEVSFAEEGKGCDTLMPSEVAFVSSISTWSSSINLVGSQAMYHILEIIRIGRSSLEAAVTSVGFFFTGCLSYCIFAVLCPCTVATSVPIIPPLGSFLYNQVILPMIGLSLAFTDGSNEFMSRVPSKNESFRYSWRGSRRIYFNGLLRAFLPAVVPHFLYLIALGELMWEFDPQFVSEKCLLSSNNSEQVARRPLSPVIRCEALRNYRGDATESASVIMLASLILCTCVASASFVFRTELIRSEPPWKRNHMWVGSLISSLILLTIYMSTVLAEGSVAALPWYFFALFLLTPFICLLINEKILKNSDRLIDRRNEMMRRLQFETKLGMWSPKESQHVNIQQTNMQPDDSPIV
mmetsp:Transcript_32820/g.67159  ORF Transcript_32820/g.67159 Transcript_32820/m.67159 type:complete len:1431 (+) Transcript_32820:87-4379(+)